jgi:NAD(P)-dependent dehydrogenase (short-subunit alcohol dehydrogenase family)
MSTPLITVITGATSGLGQIVATQLAKRGMHLALTARSQKRAEATKELIHGLAPNAEIEFFYGDLSSMQDVKRIGSEIRTAYNKIDILINNAGIHGFEQRVTSDGFAEMIAVNYFTPWLLPQTLLPLLKQSGNARIINVASEASRNHGKLMLPDDLTNISSFNTKGSSELYGKTKLLDIMFTGELARQLTDTGVTANALNPGFNVTGLGRELGIAAALTKVLQFLHIGDPQKGADIILRLALDSQYQGITGGYFNVGTGTSIVPIYPGGDIEVQKQLWDHTATLMQQRGIIDSK